MSFRAVELKWSSLRAAPTAGQEGHALMTTPATAWGYGPLSEVLLRPSMPVWLRVTVEPHSGTVGLGLVTPNGGELLTREAVLEGQGVRSLYLSHTPQMGEARILFRNYGEEGRPGAVHLLDVSAGDEGDVPAEAERFEAQRPHQPELTREMLAIAAERDELLIPISLGNSCETKFQVARILHERSRGRSAGAAFRLSMLPPSRAHETYGWELFDWRGTPLPALVRLLETDFAGAFEPEDFVPQGADVANRRFGTTHLHEFETALAAGQTTFTPKEINKAFPLARAEFDRLVRQFQEHLRTPGPYLYVHVCEDVPSAWTVFNLIEQLRARSSAHRFRLLIVGHEDSDNDLSALAPIVDKRFRPKGTAKPEARRWEGDDNAWNAALADYCLAFPDGIEASSPSVKAARDPDAP